MRLNSLKRQLFSVSVMLLFCYVSFCLFELANKPNYIAQSLSVFKQTNTIAIQELNMEAEQLREQYGYMVFKKERVGIERKLIRNIQKQINLQPFNSNLWRELTFLQASEVSIDKQSTSLDRQWTFLVSKKLLQWNTHERITLLKRCVFFSSDYQADVKSACSELFTYVLQKENFNSLARKLGLAKPVLQNVVTYYGVDKKQQFEK